MKNANVLNFLIPTIKGFSLWEDKRNGKLYSLKDNDNMYIVAPLFKSEVKSVKREILIIYRLKCMVANLVWEKFYRLKCMVANLVWEKFYR